MWVGFWKAEAKKVPYVHPDEWRQRQAELDAQAIMRAG